MTSWRNRKVLAALGLAALTLAALTLSGCIAYHPAFQIVSSGANSGLPNPSPWVTIAQDEHSYRQLFLRIATLELPRPAPPPIDFREKIAVFVSLGEKPTAGHTINIQSVACVGKAMRIKLGSSAPPEGSLSAQVITNPYLLAAVDRCPHMCKIELLGDALQTPQEIPVAR